MAIWVPLKTQENAAAKWKREKKRERERAHQMGSSCIFKIRERCYRKLESKSERWKGSGKELWLSLLHSSPKDCLLRKTSVKSLQEFHSPALEIMESSLAWAMSPWLHPSAKALNNTLPWFTH